jgi:large subunit ribosomal protein L10
MARPEKVAVVEEIRTKLERRRRRVLTEYRGLTVSELATCAARCGRRRRVQGLQEHARPPRRRGAGLTDLVPLLQGPTAIAFVHGDAVSAAKALRDFGAQTRRS